MYRSTSRFLTRRSAPLSFLRMLGGCGPGHLSFTSQCESQASSRNGLQNARAAARKTRKAARA